MRIARGRGVRVILALGTVLLVLSALGPISAAGFPVGSNGSDESIDHDDIVQKRTDLVRARANGDVSPDRLVIVYDSALAVDDAVRQQVRQRVNGQLLQASRSLQRDVVRIPAGAAAVAPLARSMPGVRDAYADPVGHADLIVNDPLLTSQWSLTTIQASRAWDTTQGQGTTVAVVDCGIHAAHPDLAGKVVLERNFTAMASTDDLCNHGTHVAGTIAADTNNAIGIAAVAPGAHLLNAKVLDDTGSGFFSDIDRGIQWAADNGAQVINLSLGASIPCPTETQTAMNYAWNKGAVVVAAAGNFGLTTGASAPANCQNVIAVAATDATDAMPSWSNSGANVQVAAPGVSILSSVNPDVNAGQLYVMMSGTSMASPHAAGILALIASTTYGGSPAAIRDRLFATADHIAGTGTLWTQGRINAAAAVNGGQLLGSATATPTATSTATPTQGGVNWIPQTLTFDDLANPQRPLMGHYPASVVDWGSGSWYLSGPWGQFSTNSISFNGPGQTSASFTFLTGARLDSLTAFNGGTVVSTLSIVCSGQPTVTASVAVGQVAAVTTNWLNACGSVTINSSNGWDTNFDNLVISTSSTSVATATTTPTPTATATTRPTNTPTPTLTSTPTSSPTSTATSTATPTRTPTPNLTATPTPGSTQQTTVTFDNLTATDRALNGQYPSGLIDWGTNVWWLASPWGLFTTNSVSFNGPSLTSAALTFVSPHRLLKLDAYNGGSGASTITLACSGQPTVTTVLAANQLASIVTNWTAACTSATIASTNGWNTNFDNIVVGP